MNDEKIKHLEFIQNIITRMNTNSFQIKGMTVTIVSALLAVYASEKEPTFILISIFPLIYKLLPLTEDCDISTNVQENHVDNYISVYPNPFNTSINIDTAKPGGVVTIFSVEGEIVHTKEIQNNSVSIHLPNAQTGVYIIEVRQKESVFIQKIVKQ